jgi:hypothetical protein
MADDRPLFVVTNRRSAAGGYRAGVCPEFWVKKAPEGFKNPQGLLESGVICSGQQDDKYSGMEALAGFAPNSRLKPRPRLCKFILTTTEY